MRGLRKVTPALVQPVEYLKVGIREDDRKGVVRAPTLQIPGDIYAAFAIEKARRVRHFMTGQRNRTVVGDEEG